MTYAIPRSDPYATMATRTYLLLFSLLCSLSMGCTRKLCSVAYLSCAQRPLVLISIRTRLIIQVDHSELKVGRAHIELKYIGEVTELDTAAMKAIRSRDANPMAFLAFRFWSSTGVKVEVLDERDETPYWLITSNKANQLVKALKRS